MDEKTFLSLADAEMTRLESRLEAVAESSEADIDIEPMPGAVLQLTFENGSQMVINRHVAAQEIWVAARSGGFHFAWQEGQWLGTRDGAELYAALSGLLSEQVGTTVFL